LLKSDLKISGATIALNFTGKGGKDIEKTLECARLAEALRRLAKLPGKRMFQYRNAEGAIVPLRRRDVNAMLQTIAGRTVSMKDFRTLTASGLAIEHLASLEPKPSERGRKRQLLATMREIANELANTPAVCRKSYVHAAVVEAFESGALRRIASRARIHSAPAREKMLAKILERIALKA